MFKEYSSSLFVYLRLSSFISNLPYDMKRYIYEFLKNSEIGSMIYHTRLSLLNFKPSLYLLKNEDKKYLNNTNKEYISLNFKGIPFIFKGYNHMNFEYFIKFPKENIKLEDDVLKKIIYKKDNNFNLDNENYCIDEKYCIYLKKTKLSKKDYLLRNHKENKTIFLEKKKKKRLLTLKKK